MILLTKLSATPSTTYGGPPPSRGRLISALSVLYLFTLHSSLFTIHYSFITIYAITSPNKMGGFTDYGMEQLSLFEPMLIKEASVECLTGEF